MSCIKTRTNVWGIIVQLLFKPRIRCLWQGGCSSTIDSQCIISLPFKYNGHGVATLKGRRRLNWKPKINLQLKRLLERGGPTQTLESTNITKTWSTSSIKVTHTNCWSALTEVKLIFWTLHRSVMFVFVLVDWNSRHLFIIRFSPMELSLILMLLLPVTINKWS